MMTLLSSVAGVILLLLLAPFAVAIAPWLLYKILN